jgi:hypothetical protein
VAGVGGRWAVDQLGPPARALTWRRILLGIHPAERAEWDPYVVGWMAEHLETGSLDQATAAPR